MVEEVEREVQEDAGSAVAAEVPRLIHNRRFIRMDHVVANQRLMDEYFAENPRYPPELFCRCFRMSQRLVLHIATSLAGQYRCFTL